MAADPTNADVQVRRGEAPAEGNTPLRGRLEHRFETILLLDAQGIARYASRSTMRLLGYAQDEIVGHSVFARMHPDDRPRMEALLTALAASPGQSEQVAYRLQHHDGSWCALEGIWTNRLDDPDLAGIVANAQDVTQRAVLEDNLQFLAQASKLLSASLDFDTIWEHLTRLAVPHIADWCAVDILNDQGVFDIAAIAHREPEKVALVTEFRRANPININDTFGLPVVVTTKQREYIPLITDDMLVAIARSERELEMERALGMTSALSVPLVVRDRGVGAITFVTSDSRKRLTETDVAMAEELASRASLALENATLYAEARQAVMLRDHFISVASHELKTPVTSLKMYTQVLHKQLVAAGEERLSASLAKMDAQVGKLTRLVDDLLNVSRLEHGRLEFRDEVVDLDALVREVVEQARLSASDRMLAVEGSVGRPLRGDRDRIAQALTNLLTNALKFSPRAAPVIVRLSSEGEGDGEAACVAVVDRGIGVAPEHQAGIFERFYRVDDPDERTYPGLGIGLYIAREIVARHGGQMRVVSARGEGAEFSFTLPYEGHLFGGAPAS